MKLGSLPAILSSLRTVTSVFSSKYHEITCHLTHPCSMMGPFRIQVTRTCGCSTTTPALCGTSSPRGLLCTHERDNATSLQHLKDMWFGEEEGTTLQENVFQGIPQAALISLRDH